MYIYTRFSCADNSTHPVMDQLHGSLPFARCREWVPFCESRRVFNSTLHTNSRIRLDWRSTGTVLTPSPDHHTAVRRPRHRAPSVIFFSQTRISRKSSFERIQTSTKFFEASSIRWIQKRLKGMKVKTQQINPEINGIKRRRHKGKSVRK